MTQVVLRVKILVKKTVPNGDGGSGTLKLVDISVSEAFVTFCFEANHFAKQ